ncbi:hypothetical protein [Phosphitispora sp. TUW77]|uniref:hypothetical protein n=1 Tax=Phosphitispora sp. TUW77 TaxID=3152361 RepID=UPI003AB2EA23
MAAITRETVERVKNRYLKELGLRKPRIDYNIILNDRLELAKAKSLKIIDYIKFSPFHYMWQ